MTPDGKGLIFSTYLGGTNLDWVGFGLALDRSGNLFVPGSTGSADFPTTPGAFQTEFRGGDGTLFLPFTDDFMVKIAFGNENGGAQPTRRGTGTPRGPVAGRPGGPLFPRRGFRVEG